jgi:uncharacterized membrane protein YcaP (DUF421 family)
MESVIRGVVVYVFLMLIFRLAGKRTLSETTSFEFVLLLIISETIQEALIDDDRSVTNGLLLILTLVGLSYGLSLLKQQSPQLERWMDGSPLLLIENGRMHRDRMAAVRVDESDLLEAARELQGLERLDQIKHAILERTGRITIVPKG